MEDTKEAEFENLKYMCEKLKLEVIELKQERNMLRQTIIKMKSEVSRILKALQ